jgi:sortase A
MSFLGSAAVLYPYASERYNSGRQTKAIAAYHTEVSNASAETIRRAFEAAERFNRKLNGLNGGFSDPQSMLKEYYDTLRLNTSNVIAYIEIPKINVHLPVYHGTGKAVLQVGVGHLEGTSLPIGGINSHASLSGHRGLPSAKLFTDLDKLEIGDVFTIYVLDKRLNYTVDSIEVVLPERAESLFIEQDKDLVTLITCTPYALNTHRLLVRGSRSADTVIEPEVKYNMEVEAIPVSVYLKAAAVCPALALLIRLILKLRRIYRKIVRKRGRRKRRLNAAANAA